MRILRMYLRSFGHFRDAEVDLDHPEGGLRIVLGPNEAGKSTLLQAVRVGLFGPSGPITAGHATSGLRLGFDYRSGDRFGHVVRSGRDEPISSTGEPVALAELVSVDRQLFERLFTIDHDELRRYGEPLLQASGGIGELVFGAALGGQGVRKVSDTLRAEADALFVPGGSTRVLHKAMKALKDADDHQRKVLFTADEWAETTGRIGALSAELESLDARSAQRRAEISRLERITNIRPRLIRRAELATRLAELLAVGPEADDDLFTRLTEALDSQARVEASAAEIERRLAVLRGELAAVPTDRRVLDRATDVVALNEQVALYRKAANDAAGLRTVVDAGTPLAEAEVLRSAVADLGALEPAARALVDRRSRLAGDESEARSTAARLGVATERLSDVLSLAVPSMDLIDGAESAASDLAARRGSAAAAASAAEQVLRDADEQVRSLGQGEEVATPEQIEQARAHRDEVVKAVRRRLRGRSDGDESDADLAQQLRDAVRGADELADTVLSDTARAAAVMVARVSAERSAAELATARDAVQRLSVEAAEQDTRWEALWAGIVARPGSPKDMRTWVGEWKQLCGRVTDVERETAALADLEAELRRGEERLRHALAAAAVEVAEPASFPALLDLARRRVEDADALDRSREDLDRASTELRRIDDELEPLLGLLPAGSTARGDRAIAELDRLREEQAGHEQEAGRLGGEIRAAEDGLRDLRSEIEVIGTELRALAVALAVPEVDLPASHQVLREAQEVRADLAGIDTELVDATGLAVEALVEQADEAGDPDRIVAELARLRDADADAAVQRESLVAERERLRVGVAAAVGDAGAPDAQQGVEDALAELGSRAQDYLRLALAGAILDRALNAGDGSEAQILDRAGRMFEYLTDGEFDAIGVEDVRGRSVAVAHRSDDAGGGRLFVPSLSDGTQDQLWLALRLSGVAQHLDRVGPVPIVVDDVLVNFDDDRAALALNGLADLARRTQVVVVTHHPHLVELARARLGHDRVVVSELGRRPRGVAPTVQVVADPAEASPAPMPEPTGGPAPSATGAAAEDARRAVLDAIAGGADRKAAIIEVSGITAAQWTSTIRALVDDGLVVLDGQRYSLPGDGTGADGDGDAAEGAGGA